MDDLEDDKISNVLVNNNPQDEDGELTQNPVINIHDINRNTAAMDGKLELYQSILGVQSEGDKPPAITKKQQMTQYLNEKLAGNRSSPVSSKTTPKRVINTKGY